ncbi:hypothetical protein A946_01990 [Methylacidiphilum kamchatkense Kam1]|uniref:Transcriptional regulator n=1 Tax=Methylacidiphilum kamchatkense Kam1 TaxID=1202785 RepID=A0A0C1RX15_9BACT|nr:hypothetical protein [Methylacidiphilum kamchatkense]KIE59466.1 hypothetical protein A946_01990 [Methylacidiphilum kamchatkense Kam1]QDQ42534.1 hypothetical protein kam1_1309 [Methylacidiphilum kamchatkense Kam1]
MKVETSYNKIIDILKSRHPIYGGFVKVAAHGIVWVKNKYKDEIEKRQRQYPLSESKQIVKHIRKRSSNTRTLKSVFMENPTESFTIDKLMQLTGKNRHSINTELYRLKNHLEKVGRGVYRWKN